MPRSMSSAMGVFYRQRIGVKQVKRPQETVLIGPTKGRSLTTLTLTPTLI